MAITIEMSKGAYEITKKVHSRQLSRVRGAIEINKQTRMLVGSISAFITIFLAMLDGKNIREFLTMLQIDICLKILEKIMGKPLFEDLWKQYRNI